MNETTRDSSSPEDPVTVNLRSHCEEWSDEAISRSRKKTRLLRGVYPERNEVESKGSQ